MNLLQSWWEVPAIAHFFSLFKSCFSLSDFTIEELEDALLTDGADEKSTYFISRLLSELLQGYYGNSNITVTTCHDWLRKIMKERWEDIEGRINPLSSAEADFHQLPLRLKVQIIHRITEYRLDAKDVEIKLQGLNATDLRLEPLGCDHNGARYWYFFGVRLYKEFTRDGDDKEFEIRNEKKRKKKKKKKVKKYKKILSIDSKSKWSVACYSVNDWKKLAGNMKGTESRRESALMLLITENFLPNLPKIVDDMERQRIAKLQSEPRRSSCRLLARKLCLAEQEAEKKCAMEREEEVKREREERINSRSFNVTKRIQSDFEKMLRLELERKWKEDADRRLQELQDRLEDPDVVISSSDDDDIIPNLEPPTAINKQTSVKKKLHDEKETTNSTMLGKRKMKQEMKNAKKAKVLKKNLKKSKKPEVKKDKQEMEDGWNRKEVAKAWKRKSSEETWRKNQRGISNEKDSDEDEDDESDHEIDQVGMKKVIDDLHEHPESWQFDSPVDEGIAPGYHSIIKRPMDLSEIERKLGSGEYETAKGFISDVFLMFNNCRLYNGPESEYTEVTDELDELFRRLVKKHLLHVKIEDELTNHHFAEPVRKTRHSSEIVVENSQQKEEGDDNEDIDSGSEVVKGTTTRAAWKEKVEAKPPEQTPEQKTRKLEAKKRGGRGRGRGRAITRGRGRGRGHVSRGRGQRFSRRTSVQRERKMSEKQQRESSEESDMHETPENDITDEVAEEEDEREIQEEKTENNEQVEGQISKISESENNKSHRSSSSSSRNSSVERDRKKEEEVTESSRPKSQNIWSLDFLASQARVLEEQQQQQRPTTVVSGQQKRDDQNQWSTAEDKQKDEQAEIKANNESSLHDEMSESSRRKSHRSDEEDDDDDDVYNFKDEEISDGRFHKHGSRESVISSTGLTTSPPAAYPMTPGYPESHRFQSPSKPLHEFRPSPHDPRPPMKHRSIDSSPPTPSSGYGSYKTSDMGRSITPNESVPTFNPATPKIDQSPEKESNLVSLQQLSTNPAMKKSNEPRPPPSSSLNLPQESPAIPSTSASLQQHAPTKETVPVEKPKENLPKIQKERSISSEKSPHHARPRLPSSNVQQNQTSLVETTMQQRHQQQQTMHERAPTRSHPQTPATQPTSKPPPTQSSNRSSQQAAPATTRAPPSTRTPIPLTRTTSRNSPRANYPEYGGINAASRYSHSNDGRSFERSLLYAAHHQSATANNPNLSASQQQQSKNHPLLQSPTMASLGLNHWSLSSGNSEPRPDQRHDIRMQHDARQHHQTETTSTRQHHGTTNEPRSHNEHRKSSVQGPSFDKSRSSSSVPQQEATRTKPRSKQPSVSSATSVVAGRSSGRHSVASYAPAEYMGYHFPTHHAPSPHDFSTQQNGLLSAATNSSLLHSDLTASARLSRVLQQQQQQHKPELQSHSAAGHASMFLQAGHYAGTPTQADQYNRLATAAAQQHQLEMYHQTTNAQNPWLPPIHPSHMDPVYQHFMQGQYPMYHNILHKY